MATRKLTAVSVERIRPPAKGQQEHFDRGYPGLALRVSYAGTKSWTFYYRVSGNPRLQRMKLGKYPEMTLADAHTAWRKAREGLDKGIDPSGKGLADTVANVAAEWLKRDQADSKYSTLRAIRHILDDDVLPAWGARRIDTITKRDAIELIDTIVDRGAPVQARRTHAYLHRLFQWALKRDIVTANPIASMERPGAETPRDRVLDDDELVAVWNACTEGTYETAVRLLLLTGARLNEIARLKWEEVHGDCIELAGDRTKNGKPHTIPLSRPALTVLEGRPRTSEFCFTLGGEQYPPTGWSRAKAKIDARAGIAPWRLHDLRRTVATGLQKLGVPLPTTEAILGHTGGSRSGIVGVYQRHSYDAEKRAALEAWGAHVTALVEGREPGKVLPIRGQR